MASIVDIPLGAAWLAVAIEIADEFLNIIITLEHKRFRAQPLALRLFVLSSLSLQLLVGHRQLAGPVNLSIDWFRRIVGNALTVLNDDDDRQDQAGDLARFHKLSFVYTCQ